MKSLNYIFHQMSVFISEHRNLIGGSVLIVFCALFLTGC
jgi:hypothetical protein